MAPSIAPTVPPDRSVDVRINGAAAAAMGIRTTEIALTRLHLVRALPQTDQIPQTASS
jgi:CYTH domain-containing protein